MVSLARAQAACNSVWKKRGAHPNGYTPRCDGSGQDTKCRELIISRLCVGFTVASVESATEGQQCQTNQHEQPRSGGTGQWQFEVWLLGVSMVITCSATPAVTVTTSGVESVW